MNEDLKNYCFKDAFINQDRQVEIIVEYGNVPETVIYADVDEVKGMINPEYIDCLN